MAYREEDHEPLSEEELNMLVLEAQEEALQVKKTAKRTFPKWFFWLIALFLFFSTFSFVFKIYSIPAIEFLQTSAELSMNQDIQTYKKAVVTIEAGERKGTGFSITSDGRILTNYHVIEGNSRVTVIFPENGRFTATVVEVFSAIDLAVLEVKEKGLPYLQAADNPSYSQNEPIQFIGNPLSFEGIANEGTIITTLRLAGWQEDVVMIDAPVYKGNSGSPVLDDRGLVIGIVFSTLEHAEHGKVGLFIPIELYKKSMTTSEE